MEKPIKILSIEDDEFIRIFLRDIFWLHGAKDKYELYLVDNLDEAKKYLAQSEAKPDLIFLDLMVPERKGEGISKEAGFHFLEQLKSNPQTKNIKVVIFSAYRDKELRDRALKLGADKFLIKGEHLPQELIKITEEMLGKKQDTVINSPQSFLKVV